MKSNGFGLAGLSTSQDTTNTKKTFEDLLETEETNDDENEECNAEFTPVVNLQPHTVTTGEEEENTIFLVPYYYFLLFQKIVTIGRK